MIITITTGKKETEKYKNENEDREGGMRRKRGVCLIVFDINKVLC